jgi:hypothetical protein
MVSATISSCQHRRISPRCLSQQKKKQGKVVNKYCFVRNDGKQQEKIKYRQRQHYRVSSYKVKWEAVSVGQPMIYVGSLDC